MPDEIFNWLKTNKKQAILIVSALIILDVTLFLGIFSDLGVQNKLVLHFFDVGQGDSEFVVLPGGVKMLIDGGPTNGRVMNELARSMSQGDRYIDLVLMTHPQLDHFGGLIDVAKQYTIGTFIWSGRESDAPAFQELKKELRGQNAHIISLSAGDSIHNEKNDISILSPHVKFLNDKDLNNSSLVIRVSSASTTALFVGDIGANVEEYLVRNFDIQTDILKVPHHGSRFSSTDKFLHEVSPKLAIIEVGKNSYGHPTQEVLTRLSAIGARILRTDLNGATEIISEGTRSSVHLSRER
ncbi:MAG: MBL fold metallo-hydrolase [Candidatus Paceibacterota bacterium]|jgi:competence protein ComEC